MFPDLWNQTWRLYTATDDFGQLYSATVNMQFKILQRVDDNNVVFYRSLRTDELQHNAMTFFLFSRYEANGSFYVTFRSLNPKRFHAVFGVSSYLDMFSW